MVMARTCQLQSMFSRSSRCTFESLLAVEVASRSMHVECITKDPIVRRNKHMFHTLYYQIPNSHSRYPERPGNGTETIPERPPKIRPRNDLPSDSEQPGTTRNRPDHGTTLGRSLASPAPSDPGADPKRPQSDLTSHKQTPAGTPNAPETPPKRPQNGPALTGTRNDQGAAPKRSWCDPGPAPNMPRQTRFCIIEAFLQQKQ